MWEEKQQRAGGMGPSTEGSHEALHREQAWTLQREQAWDLRREQAWALHIGQSWDPHREQTWDFPQRILIQFIS